MLLKTCLLMIFDDTWWLDDTWSRLMLLDVTWCNPFFVGNHPELWGIPAVFFLGKQFLKRLAGNCANAKDRGWNENYNRKRSHRHLFPSLLIHYTWSVRPINTIIFPPVKNWETSSQSIQQKASHLWSKKNEILPSLQLTVRPYLSW